MQVAVLVRHHEGGVVALASALDNILEGLLQSAADLDVPHAC